MNKSKYNTLIENVSEDENIIFNSISSGFAIIDNNELKMYKNHDQLVVGEAFTDELIRGNFIYEENVDEVEVIGKDYKYSKETTKVLTLTILPTLNCNFRCDYCYQSKTSRSNNETMSEEVQENILEFIKHMVEDRKYEMLALMWYGGEPTLEFDIIVNLASKINSICYEKNMYVSHQMITNGYLLSIDRANILKKLGFDHIQITIDGLKDIHDNRRVLANKCGSFDKIIKNINDCYKLLNIIIRTNVDDENIVSLRDYIDFMSKQEFSNSIFFAFVCTSPHTTEGIKNDDKFYNLEGFSSIIYEIKKYAIEKGLNIESVPKRKFACCSSNIPNSYVIEPSGNVKKCMGVVGVDKYNIGNIGSWNELHQNSIKWLEFNPLIIEKCVKCSVLPLCMGGCPYEYFESDCNDVFCSEIKYDLENSLKLNYFFSRT